MLLFIKVQNFPFIVSLSTAAVLHRKSASPAGTTFNTYHAHRHSKSHIRCTYEYTKTKANHVSYVHNLFIPLLYCTSQITVTYHFGQLE